VNVSARDEIADALTAALPDVRVDVDGIGVVPETGGLVVLAPSAVRPGHSPLGFRTWVTDVWVVTALTEPGQAETDLELLLLEVLDVLDAATMPGVWVSADRTSYAETHPAYRITLETDHG
jgi:hypothetical protein